MSKRKGGGKGQDETNLQIMERIAPKKFIIYGIPVHKQFMARIEGYLDEDSDFEQLHIWEEAGPNGIKAMMDAIKESGIITITSIRLWKVKALDEGVRAVSSYLAMENIVVKTLDLMDNGITALGCDFLGKALHPSSNKTLQKLMIDHNLIGTEGLKNLSEGIAMSPTLTHLSLSYCGLDKDSGKPLQLCLAFIDSKLEFLNLQGNALGVEGTKEIMKAMNINSTVTELNLSDNKFGDDLTLISYVCTVIENEKSPLFMFDIKYNEIGEEGISKLMESIGKLKKTKIDVTDRFKKETSTALATLLKGIKKPKKKKATKKKTKK